MTIQETLDYIHSVCWKGSVPGLSRTKELLHRMGDPHKKLKFVHIAGTNGKGSTASMLASVFRKAGYKTGLYTSPYIIKFNERMQINGEMIPDEELCAITEMIRPLADTMEDSPTEFELVTCIGMEYFARNNCDIVILEVGMGGEFDSTNVIDCPEASVIVNIGLDHTGVLGETVEEIAHAKAGIIKGGDTILYRSSPSVEAVFYEKCKAVGSRFHLADFQSIRLREEGFWGQIFDCKGMKKIELPLLGNHQRKNTAVVLKTLSILRQKGWSITEENIRDGLKTVSWPGRFELLRREPVFFADGGHNPQCMESLAENIRSYLPDRGITALVGVMADKDYMDMFFMVAPYITRFVTVTPDNPRALPAADLAKALEIFGKPVTICESVEDGVRTAIGQTTPEEAVVAFGSLYMLGTIREAAHNYTGPINKNYSKQKRYKDLTGRLTKAIKNGFWLEACMIEYGILEDRTSAILYYAKVGRDPFSEKKGLKDKLKTIQEQIEKGHAIIGTCVKTETIESCMNWKYERDRLVHQACKIYSEEIAKDAAVLGQWLVKQLSKESQKVRRCSEKEEKQKNR